MSVDLKKVEEIAFLARIGVDEQNINAYQKDMNQILGLIDEMQTVDLSNIEPMFHPISVNQLLTEDKPIHQEVDDIVFENAPASESRFFLVPTVIE